MKRPAALASLSIIAAASAVLAFAPAVPLPLSGRAVLGMALALVALASGHRPWADQTQATWVRAVGAIAFAVGLSVVIAGGVVLAVLRATAAGS